MERLKNRYKFMMNVSVSMALGAALGFVVPWANAQQLTPEQTRLRAIYKELVEIDTTPSGNCTRAAQAMQKRFIAAGFPAADTRVLTPPGGEKKGNLVVRLRGSGAQKPLLLLAHIDVVEALKETWKTDPFKLTETDGYFYARGAADNKAMASILTANLLRFRTEKYRPDRDLILALTCDEEIIPSAYNGVDFLLKNHRALIDAELALNEGGGGELDRDGKRVRISIQAGEKVFQSFRLEATNPGGHSAVPRKENALYDLAAGLARLAQFDFPAKVLPVVRANFQAMSAILTGPVAEDMKALAANPADEAAIERLSRVPNLNAQLRTTCVATMAEAGHATNALPQRATAVVNCRVLPGESVDEVRGTLARVIANDKIRIVPMGEPVLSPPAPLDERILGPVTSIIADLWPGVPLVPTMSAGATDSRFLNSVGIPSYGINGLFNNLETSGAHTMNERLPVRSLYEGQVFLYRLVKMLAGGK